MNLELKRVDPLRTANVLALLYGLFMLVFALIFAPFLLLAGLFASAQGEGFAGPLFAILLLCVYPIMGLVMGWIGGLVTAAIYNFVVRLTGGLLLEVHSLSPGSSDVAA